MKKILIVEDDSDKCENIKKHLFSIWADVVIEVRESLRTGLREIIENPCYDLLILDMSLPNFDINQEEPSGGTPESFAGREIMNQMKLRNILIPVIVITQYNSFDHGKVTLTELNLKFVEEYEGFYMDAIYYDSAYDDWKNELNSLLVRL